MSHALENVVPGARFTPPHLISLGAVALVALGAFLPWVSFFGISKLGIEGDGAITLFLAVVGAVAIVVSSKRAARALAITAIVLASLTSLVGLIDLADAGSVAVVGLYLTFFGALVWVASSIWLLVSLPKGSPQDRSGSAPTFG